MRAALLTLVVIFASFDSQGHIIGQLEPQVPNPIPVGPWFFYPETHRLPSKLVDSDYRAKLSGSKTPIPGAPALVDSMYFSYGRLDSGRICFSCEMASFPERFPGATFSMDKYRDLLVKVIVAAGQKAAYSSSTGSELIVTTHPEPLPPIVPRTYYQVRFLASNCALQPALYPCRLWGQAIKIKVEGNAGNETSRETTPDPLALELEQQLRTFVVDIIGELDYAAAKREKVKQ